VAVFADRSSFSQMTRDHGQTGLGFTSLSNMRIVLGPPQQGRAEKKAAPGPKRKSLFLPPSRQITAPVWRSSL
jgi:hypothetical protein